MKSVIRSAFDPLPRFPSARMQWGVTLVLVAGIAISVLEYLESSRLAQRSSVEAAESKAASAQPAGPSASQPGSTVNRSRWTAARTPSSEHTAPVGSPSAAPSGAASANRPSPMSFRPGEDG